MRKYADKILNPLIAFLHETLGLTPNQVSTIGFVIGLAAAAFAASGLIVAGLALMALSQIIDALDGGIARRYNLQSRLGYILEIIYDRLCELTMFLALVYAGLVPLGLTLLAFAAILLVTAAEPRTHFDPGFKRFMLYFGWLAGMLFPVNGFVLAMNVVFFANLAVFATGTVLAELRLQRAVDTEAIAQREALRASGAPMPPDDPPTLLSRFFSWL